MGDTTKPRTVGDYGRLRSVARWLFRIPRRIWRWYDEAMGGGHWT